MSFFEGDFDIVQKLQIIEKLKSGILSKVADLYANMVDATDGEESNLDILADVVMLSYLLSHKLGSGYEALDVKMLNKLKLSLLNDSNNIEWNRELSGLMKHLMKTHNISDV